MYHMETVEITCTRPAQVHTRQNSSTKKGGEYEQPSFCNTLLAIHEAGRELIFFKSATLWLHRTVTYSRIYGEPPTLIDGIIKKYIKLNRKGGVLNFEGVSKADEFC